MKQTIRQALDTILDYNVHRAGGTPGCLFLGAISNAIMEKSGFGLAGGTLMVMAAFATALLIRDAFFRAGANLALEPFLSIGMMLCAMTLLLLSGVFAKLRLP